MQTKPQNIAKNTIFWGFLLHFVNMFLLFEVDTLYKYGIK